MFYTCRKRVRAAILLAGVISFTSPAISQDEDEQLESSETEVKEAVELVKPESAQQAESHANESRGLLGPVRIGPYVSVAIPHPLTFGIDGVYKELFSFGFSTSSFDSEIGSVEIGLSHWDIRARWHVFQGSFFIGAAFGQQSLTGKASDDISFGSGTSSQKIPTTVDIEIKTSYLTPHIGWLWIWDSGFNMGFELGLQLPSGNKTEFNSTFRGVDPAEEAAVKDSKDYKDLEKDVKDAGDLIGKTTLPHMTMFRIGWFF